MGKKHKDSHINVPFIKGSNRGQLAAASVACLGVLASMAVYSVVSQREHKVLHSEFELRVQEIATAIERQSDTALAVVESLAALYMSSETVTPEEFHIFTRPLLERHKCMSAIGYTPIIQHAQRAAFEQSMRDLNYTDYCITEKNLVGKMVPAQTRQEYVPIERIEPLKKNQTALGFDIFSETVRKAAISRSVSKKIPSATGPIELVQRQDSHTGFLLMVPVVDKGDKANEVSSLAVGVFDVKDLVNEAMKDIRSQGLQFDLHETGPSSELQGIYSNQSPEDVLRHNDETHKQNRSVINIAGRTWTLVASPTPAFEAQFLTSTPWNVMLCGLLFTAVVSVHLLRLNSLNNQLLVSENKFKLLAENINSVFWIMSPDAQTVYYVSPGFKNLFGIDPDELYEKPRLFLKAIHPDDQKQVTRAIRGLSYGLDFHEEWRIITQPKGDLRWIFNHGFPVILDDGTVNHIVGIASDITQQKRTQEELEQLKQRQDS